MRSFRIETENFKAFMGAAQNIDPALLDGTKARHKHRRDENLRRKHAQMRSEF